MNNIYTRLALGVVVGVIALYVGYNWVQHKNKTQEATEAQLREQIQPMVEKQVRESQKEQVQEQLDSISNSEKNDRESKGGGETITSEHTSDIATDVDDLPFVRGFMRITQADIEEKMGEGNDYSVICNQYDTHIDQVNGSCRSSEKNYVFFAPTAEGVYYCFDRAGFEDVVQTEPQGLFCQSGR